LRGGTESKVHQTSDARFKGDPRPMCVAEPRVERRAS
jgi:hypothetical protein